MVGNWQNDADTYKCRCGFKCRNKRVMTEHKRECWIDRVKRWDEYDDKKG